MRVVGDGRQRGELARLARALDLRHTEFTGCVALEKMREFYDAADIYLNGSNIGNMPLSILEAYAAGLPVVTTDAGGIPYIVVMRDGPAVPCEIMKRWRPPPCVFWKMKRSSQRYLGGAAECRKYDPRVIGDKWIELYRELSSARTARQRVPGGSEGKGGGREATVSERNDRSVKKRGNSAGAASRAARAAARRRSPARRSAWLLTAGAPLTDAALFR